MLSTVIALALRFRTLVIFAAGVLLVLGLRAAEKTPLDVFPEFAQPMIEIQTEAPGPPPKRSRVWSHCLWRQRSRVCRI